ncbi:hypothetical protein IT402_01340 [Candidatus Nomurabacteria bacterium]|nr:hypothetical protein [Candidatus Nomurabacteria bacterium]
MLEAYEKELDKNSVSEEEQTPKWQKTTLKEILGKKEDSDLFGEIMAREGDLELSKRMASGELTEDDISELDNHRLDFLNTMQEVKVAKESITNDVVTAYTDHNPELKKIVGLVGIDAYRDMVKEELARLAIRNPDQFDPFYGAVKDKNEFKSGIYKDLDEEITKMCADRGIKPESYLKAMAIEDPEERAKALKSAVKEKWGNWKKAANFLTGGSWASRRAELMGSKKEELDLTTEAMKLHRSNIGEFLASLTSDIEIRSAVAKELIGDKKEKVPVDGFKESKGQMQTEEQQQEDWEDFKLMTPLPEGKDWSELNTAEQDLIRDSFIEAKKEEQAQKKGLGFWGAIFSLFSIESLTINKANLK